MCLKRRLLQQKQLKEKRRILKHRELKLSLLNKLPVKSARFSSNLKNSKQALNVTKYQFKGPFTFRNYKEFIYP
jgi:hypothetical protein